MSILTISSQQVLEDSVLSFNARTVLTLNGSTGYELILKQRYNHLRTGTHTNMSVRTLNSLRVLKGQRWFNSYNESKAGYPR